ncbi:hypothetical protein [Clavibacter sp. VKM Ac-2542]|uniref:hypothetical protein n=1 Tax=Clavibacter TaxID=1573 RepID=UPI00188DA946|nr:hypothetical protein [Clavibacter sp. VKM Ac-2542]MBF4622253.1 hypothetical protein [Clavibacter sp. VKM Ac-2542]
MADAWTAFYSAMAGFAGTLFAITVAARTIGSHRENEETRRQNWTRFFESLAVIYELAAATVFAISAGVRGTIPATVTGVFVAGVGILLYVAYCIAFLRRRGIADRHSNLEWLFLAIAAFPMLAYLFVIIYFLDMPLSICLGQVCVSPADLTDIWFPLSIIYLVASGVVQTLVFYVRNWKFV